MEPHVNFLAVFMAALAHFLFGWAWHSPLLFAKTWSKEMGFDKWSKKQRDAGMKKMPMAMAGNFLALLVTAYVLAQVLQALHHFLQCSGVGSSLQICVWLWLGFYATTLLNGVLWENRSWKLYAINASYHLVGLLLMGAILTHWS